MSGSKSGKSPANSRFTVQDTKIKSTSAGLEDYDDPISFLNVAATSPHGTSDEAISDNSIAATVASDTMALPQSDVRPSESPPPRPPRRLPACSVPVPQTHSDLQTPSEPSQYESICGVQRNSADDQPPRDNVSVIVSTALFICLV